MDFIDSNNRVWYNQPDEPLEDFKLFERYLFLGLPTGPTPGMRSIDWLADETGRDAQDIQAIADLWCWEERCLAHDAYMIDAAVAISLDDLDRIYRRAGATLRTVAMREIVKLERDSRQRPNKIRDWKGTDLLRMLESAEGMEKRARGRGAAPRDLSQLDDETLSKLREVWG